MRILCRFVSSLSILSVLLVPVAAFGQQLRVAVTTAAENGFNQYSIPLPLSQKRTPQAFDAVKAVDHRFVAAAMKAAPSAFADLKEIPAAQRL